jgi:hypothetical protein
MADKRDPIDVLNAGMDSAMDDIKSVMLQQTDETERPLVGEPVGR